MKIIHSVLTASFVTALLYFDACTPVIWNIGGNCSVFNRSALGGSSVACVFPVYATVEGKDMPQDDSASIELWKEIDVHKLFELVPFERVKSAIRERQSWDSSAARTISHSLGARAYITSRLNIYIPSNDNPIEAFAFWVVDSKTDSVVAYSHHSTYVGIGH